MNEKTRPLPDRLRQPLALRKADENGRATILGGQRADYLDAPRVLDEMRDRFELLFDHYRIPRQDDDAWMRLAVALAVEHVPGLRVAKSGRKRADNLLEKFETIKQSWSNGVPSDMQVANRIAAETGQKGSTVLRRIQEQREQAKARITPEEEAALIREMAIRLGMGSLK